MPTYESSPAFDRQFDKLSAAEKAEFMKAVKLFVNGLRSGAGRFHPSLRVHPLKSTRSVYSLTWGKGGKGRATFSFGSRPLEGEAHIAWIGITPDHSLYKG